MPIPTASTCRLPSRAGTPAAASCFPGYRGLSGYRCSLEDFYLREACEVEISFDARAGKNEEGDYTPNQLFRIDFRANTDGDPRLLLPDAQRILLPPDGEVAALLQTL